jgi:hypothetical protein
MPQRVQRIVIDAVEEAAQLVGCPYPDRRSPARLAPRFDSGLRPDDRPRSAAARQDEAERRIPGQDAFARTAMFSARLLARMDALYCRPGAIAVRPASGSMAGGDIQDDGLPVCKSARRGNGAGSSKR